MSAMSPRQRTRIRALVVLVGLSLASGLLMLGGGDPVQRDARAGMQKQAIGPQPYVIPASDCNRCHSHPEDYTREADRLLCRMGESLVWEKADKHKIAFKVLQDKRAQDMGKSLNISVTENAACLNCHGTPQVAEGGRPPFDRRELVENGVSCVACHGAYKEWVQEHPYFRDDRWRKNSRREKETRYGMTDLWDPVTRATKCASCHIGDPDGQKVVTHAMYAAGHPPLPGLETATFSDAQPRHWEYIREKKDAAKKALGFDPSKREQTELVAVSGIVALRESMRLYATQAREDGLVKEPETHWPDFARFDCYACHHDLQANSWRQKRGFAGTPGRPPAPNWPDVLVRLGITVADPDGKKGLSAQFDQAVAAYHNALGGRPFGDRDRSAEAAQALADWARNVSQDMRGMIENPKVAVVDGALTLRLLRQLCKMAEAKALDYDSARQIALAFRTIYREAKVIDPKSIPDKAVGEILDTLIARAGFSLPSEKSQAEIVNTLDARLKAVYEFDPVVFRDAFAALAGHL